MLNKKAVHSGGAWVAQLVKHPTLAQVMILQFLSSSPTTGSLLSVQSLLHTCLPLSLHLPHSFYLKNKYLKKKVAHSDSSFTVANFYILQKTKSQHTIIIKAKLQTKLSSPQFQPLCNT